MKKKYEFTGETITFEGKTLKQIRYVREMHFVIQSGRIGGWIESEHNLSQKCGCVVLEHAKVFGNARVTENAIVSQNAIVKDNVLLRGFSHVAGYSIVGADTVVDDESWISGESQVFFYANSIDENDNEYPNVFGDSRISGKTFIEATGYIQNSKFHNKTLMGHVELKNIGENYI